LWRRRAARAAIVVLIGAAFIAVGIIASLSAWWEGGLLAAVLWFGERAAQPLARHVLVRRDLSAFREATGVQFYAEVSMRMFEASFNYEAANMALLQSVA
jgi:hypothetical protein